MDILFRLEVIAISVILVGAMGYPFGMIFREMVERGMTFCYGKLSNLCGIVALITLMFAWYANIGAGGLTLGEVAGSFIETAFITSFGLYSLLCGYHRRKVLLKEIFSKSFW
jgi:hypothetical protein